VVTARAAKLIAGGVRPEEMLLVTFTNKAAGEMKERLRLMAGAEATSRLWAGTFHSICARILRKLRGDAEREGRSADFSIYDDKDTLALVKRAATENGLDPKMTDHQEIRSWISWRKNGGGAWSHAEGDREPRFIPEDLVPESELEEKWRAIWVDYDRLLTASNAYDFDDLLGVMMRLVEGGSALGNGICHRWSHVIVDEYQDTNEVQFRLVRALSARRNLCVVGDHRQAIYGFRGANYRNILLFKDRYEDAEVVSLDTNYRSDGNIVTCFNALFEDSEMKPVVGRSAGKKIEVAGCIDEEHEATAVCGRIATALEMGVPPSEIAVLYRVHALSRAIEERLRDSGLAYQVVGGLSFYERSVVKNALAYVRLVTNPHSDVDLERVINLPPRGLGPDAIGRLHVLAAERRCSLWDAIPSLIPLCTPKPARGLQSFQLLVKQAQEDYSSKRVGLADIVESLLVRSGYRQRLMEERTTRQEKIGAEDLRRPKTRKGRVAKEVVEAERAEQNLLNLDQVVAAVEAYEGRIREPTLQGYLEEVALITDQDQLKDGAVSLMTIHAAKGLEYQYVFVVGVESKILPFVRAEDLSEELRLLFVAVSRAKKSLSLSYAMARRMFGQIEQKCPSDFLNRVPLELIEPVGDYRHYYKARVRTREKAETHG